MLGKLLLVVLLTLPSVIQLAGPGGNSFGVVRGEDDILPDDVDDDTDADATVETDEGPVEEETTVTTETPETSATESEKEEEEEAEKPLQPSPDADTHLLFIRPAGTDFPAGHLVKLLVGFRNKGSQDFVLDTMDAAFRYPQDYSFYIQNFTAYQYHRTVEPSREATLEYSFTPAESFSARSFGLTISLNYHDADGNVFQDAVFNSTINVTEPDEGLDGETFFLYLFLVAVVVLLAVGAHQLFSTLRKKHPSLKVKTHAQPTVEMGTQNNRADVDYDWLPKETLMELNKPAGGRSPKSKTSPRQRNNKRRSGAVDD